MSYYPYWFNPQQYRPQSYWYNPTMQQPYPAMTMYQSTLPNYSSMYPNQFNPQQGYYPQKRLGLGSDLAGIMGFGLFKWLGLRGLAGY